MKHQRPGQGALMIRGRVDIGPLRDAVTVADVLRAAGIDPPPPGRRMRCPIHGGDNPSTFAIDDRRWRCWACLEHGDVIDLARHLHGLDVRGAIEHVADLAGIDLARAPQVSREAVERRALIARRRAGLRRWRQHELTAIADQQREIEADVFALRLTTDEEARWSALAVLAAEADRLAAREAELVADDEGAWLAMAGAA